MQARCPLERINPVVHQWLQDAFVYPPLRWGVAVAVREGLESSRLGSRRTPGGRFPHGSATDITTSSTASRCEH